MKRPIAYDLTHLVVRMLIRAPSGIDKVDLAYGRYFAAHKRGPGIHYGITQPHVLRQSRIGEVVKLVEATNWESSSPGSETSFRQLKAWLLGRSEQRPLVKHFRQWSHDGKALVRQIQQFGWRFRNDHHPIARGTIYINAAQLLLEYPFYFRWLKHRSDIKPVFMIHDLLPLDYPEYWKPGYRSRFDRRISTAARYGAAFITTTTCVRDRLAKELEQRGLPERPIHVAPLPSSLRGASHGPEKGELSAVPYFVVLGTIEPRKNHLLLLNIWRRIAERGDPVPKLVVIGARGWQNQQTFDFIDRCHVIRPHVFEISGLSSANLAEILVNARALLMPSFAEGYGLPLVEALSLGVPTVASDIHVFREITQGCASYLHPLDGEGWERIIIRLARGSALADANADLQKTSKRFRSPTWDSYFNSVEDFVDGL